MGISKQQREERERLAESGLKRCSIKSGCGEIKSVEEFGSKKGTWDNKHSICRICDRERSNRYRKENPEASRASVRQYSLNNRDAKREYGRTYFVKRSQADPMYYRLRSGKERAQKAGVEWENVSSTDLLSHWKQNNMSIDICHYCNNHIELDELEIDHGVPICSGGGHTIDNLFPSHKKCNREKNDMTVDEYNQYLKQAV